jgi:L-aspartate oxidase
MDDIYDFLVIGSGLAGLQFALSVAEHGKVAVLCKSEIAETNTQLAQGGIAGVIYDPKDEERHIADTLGCGAGLCDEGIVRSVVAEAKERISYLAEIGANFDKDSTGKYHLVREGGHSSKRILHFKDSTGNEIQRALINSVMSHRNITVFEHVFALDIITQHHLGQFVDKVSYKECYGAYVLDLLSGKTSKILSRSTMIATGGIGYIYQTTTNPPNATGDGIAMVYRAKGLTDQMEFVQFHPTALFNPGEKPSFLITEAMRGHGAELRDIHGQKFMHKYDSRGSLAPRDIVARAIDTEMKIAGSDYVYLDCTTVGRDALMEEFPNIYSKCLSIGIDISERFVPVSPAAHYICGGITVDSQGRTSINRLYAAGEVSCTGLHGANRLASNSLLEAAVFAHRAAIDCISNFRKWEIPDGIPHWDISGTTSPEEMVLITQSWKELQQIMSSYVGIVRSDIRLSRAKDRLEILYRETEELYKRTTVSQKLCELRNAINVAYLVIKMASGRRESIGLHYSLDYPSIHR